MTDKPSAFTFADNDPLPNATLAISVFARGVMIIVTLFCAVMIFVVPANIVRWIIIAAICGVTSGVSLILVRKNYAREAATLLLGGLWAIITVSALSQGGMEAPGIGSFLILILCAGLFCGNTAGVIMGIVVVVTEFGFVLLEQNGQLPPVASIPTPWNLWIRQIFFSTLAVMTQQAATRLVGTAMRRMKKELIEKETAWKDLEEMEQKFETFASATFEGVAITYEGILVEINDQFAGMLGYKHDETLNRPVLDFVAPESRELVRQRITGRIEGSYQHLCLRKDGSTFPVEVQSRMILYRGRSARATVIRDVSDRLARESALRISEQKYRDIISWAPVGIFRSSAEGKVLMANRALANILGFADESELLGLDSASTLYADPAARSELVAKFDTRSDGSVLETEVEWKRKDNSRIWVSLTGHTARDPESGERYYEGFVFDVTQRRNAAEILRQGEERFRTLIEHAPLAIDISREGATIYSNKKCLEMFGFASVDEVKATPIAERWAEHDRPLVLARIRARDAGQIVPAELEGTGLRRNGQTFPLTASVSRVMLPDGPASIAVLIDNTEQKRAQESLRLRSAALEAAANAILITDINGNIEWVNPAFTNVSGYTLEEAVGKNPRDLIKSGKQDRAFYEQQWKTILAGNVWKGHLTNKRKDGTLYEEEMTITPVRSSDGGILHFIAIKQDVTDQMLSEKALRDSEERFRSLFDRMQDGVYQSTHEGKFVDVNEAFAKMFGYASREEILNIDIKKELYFAPEERGSHVLDTGKEEVEVYRMRRKDGAAIFVEDHGRYVHDEQGNIIFHEGILRDVTDRRRAAMLQEAVYRISEAAKSVEKLEDLYLSIHTIVGELMPARNLYIALYDPATDTMTFPYHADEHEPHWPPMKAGKTLTGYVLRTGESLLATPEVFADLRRRGEVELIGLDSSSWLGVPLKTRSGQILGAMVIQTYRENERLQPKDKDILAFVSTQVAMALERRNAEEKLRQSEEQFRLISENIADLITVLDAEGTILYVSPSHASVFVDPSALLGLDIFRFIHPDDRERVTIIFHAELQTGVTHRFEYRMSDERGGIHSFESHSSVIRDSTGGAPSVLFVSRDKTEQNRLEQQMLRMQRLESIGTLASGVAHDLNNVLAPIILAIELLRNASRTDAERKMLDNLKSTAQRGAGIVSQILGFARGMEGERSALHVRQLVKEIAKIVEETFPKSIVLQVHLTSDVPLIRGDQTQIHQVLLNLCVNARDAMPRGGTLSISLENYFIDETYAKVHPGVHPGHFVLLSVADTGSGIPPEILGRIFEPFFTTKERGKGTGLGLSTVHGIVKSHGGFVDVYSERGSGTTFRVYLPAGEGEGAAHPLAAKEALLRGNGEVILVVDDEESILEITRETLGAFGYNVITAADGASALAEYGARKDEIALVITDMMMPILDGQQTIFALRSMNPKIKIIGCSGLAVNGKHIHGASGAADAFITKPYTAEILLETIAKVLKG